jgi:hypothetical protein
MDVREGFYTQPAGTAMIEVYGTSGPSVLQLLLEGYP